MKQHTADFINEIKNMGRQINSIITYGQTTLHDELYAVTPHFEANILKSIMKQLDIESSVDIPLDTVVNYQLGVLVNGNYEYLDYGNYVVYKSEKQEDTKTYKITCYDKMLYAMKDYEDLGITYPITIKNYLNAIGTKLEIGVEDTTFANQGMQIPGELYLDLGYTYRDVLDEIAQATGSIIVINENDNIEVKYPTNTSDTINEEFLKDVNVNFGEKYGPINSIVLSRAGESDNVYLQNAQSIAQDGLTEIKIVDNQIMNFNNRSDYLPGILSKLNGFYYYINDFNSTGILYYDVADLYTIQIGNTPYQCCMLNDEINIKLGIEELIHTDMPEESETDYTKADKTDRRINQTYIIVDKQNQTIESVVNNTTEQNQKISRIEQTVDELNSKISDVADITTSQESTNGELDFENINQSEPIRIVIHPRAVNISYLYPRANLYPSNTLYPQGRTLQFVNTSTNEVTEYELPTDLLYYDADNYDEFILDYDSQTCYVNKKVGYNADGTTYLLSTPTTISYTPYPEILLTDGDYHIELLGHNTAYIFVRLMSQNIYTTQFATKAELSSSISQTAEEINLTVSQKVGKNEVVSSINQTSESVTINANKFNINGVVSANGNFKVDTNGNMECSNAKISASGGSNTGDASGLNLKVTSSSTYNYSGMAPGFLVVRDGQYRYINGETQNTATTFNIHHSNNYHIANTASDTLELASTYWNAPNSFSQVSSDGIITPSVTQTSLESIKKNIEKLDVNALDIIKNADLYKYNLKTEKDTDKERYGFVIGEKYNTPKEVLSKDGQGIEIYSMASIMWKAIQEQQKEIEYLKNEIKLLKGEK